MHLGLSSQSGLKARELLLSSFRPLAIHLPEYVYRDSCVGGADWTWGLQSPAVLAHARLFLKHVRSRRHLPNGQIASAVGDKCICSLGGAVILAACEGASAWEVQGNGARFTFTLPMWWGDVLHCVWM